MFLYFLVFIIAFIYLLIYDKGAIPNKENWPLAVFFLYLALFVGLGDMIGGYDRYIYGDGFDAIANELRTASPDIHRMMYLVSGREYGYFYWEVFVAMITQNRYIFILLTTILAYVLYYKAFKEYVSDYPLAVIIFLGFFFYFTMTYLRQVLACGIMWQGLKYIWQRRPIPFFCIGFLAYSFHNSALIFLPMYFIPMKQYSQTTVIIFLLISFGLGLSPLPLKILASSTDRATSGYEDQIQGFRIEYVLEAALIIYVIFRNYLFIPQKKEILSMVNGSILFCGILLFFMRFGQGGRMGWFYILPLIITMTTLSNGKDVYYWMRPGIVIVCFFLWLRITFSWSAQNVPYKTFLTNGEPAGNGVIYKQYEYDKNYTVDKLYRKAWDPVFPFHL